MIEMTGKEIMLNWLSFAMKTAEEKFEGTWVKFEKEGQNPTYVFSSVSPIESGVIIDVTIDEIMDELARRYPEE